MHRDSFTGKQLTCGKLINEAASVSRTVTITCKETAGSVLSRCIQGTDEEIFICTSKKRNIDHFSV
jgi:hypothetical protein